MASEMRSPFEVPFEELQANPDEFIRTIFSSLESEFLIMPKGDGFVEYPVLEAGYEALKKTTAGFANNTPDRILPKVAETPIALVVLRAMLGFTPSEWAYMATRRTGVAVGQGFARRLDREIREEPLRPIGLSGMQEPRVKALVETACQLLAEGASTVNADRIHRLNKADTIAGWDGVRRAAEIGIPYAMLLYERFLGRPFAGHRDSVSELVGDDLEARIEDVLSGAGISYRKTKRAERLPGFDQAPDFVVASEFNPTVVIEAKVTEDDGTARDKVTRIQHLYELSMSGQAPDQPPKFEVVACIGGRGFGVRREDMRKLLHATRGKVFTPKTLDRMVEFTRLKEFRSR